VNAFRAALLLTRLRFVRMLNLLGSAFLRRLGSVKGGKRTATAGKGQLGWLVGAVAGLFMLGAFTNLAVQAGTRMRDALDGTPRLPGHVLTQGFERAASLELTILLVAALLLMIGTKELAQADWDLEWLVTLPISTPALIGARFAERTVVNPSGWIDLWPFASVVAWLCGFGAWAPVVGLGLTLPLLVTTAVLRTLVDTGMRMRMRPAQLRNLQAVLSIAATATLYLGISPGLQVGRSYVVEWSQRLPAWTAWWPTSLVIDLLSAAQPATRTRDLLLLVVEIAALTGVGFLVLAGQLRRGVVAGGERETGRARVPAATVTPGRARPGWLSPIQARELRLLSRDRNFLVQTLVLPILIVGGQFFLGARGVATGTGGHETSIAVIAFIVSGYSLMFSAFQTLNAEWNALWILFCVPQSLESMLRQKAWLWGTAVLAYPIVIFASSFMRHGVTPHIAWQALVVLIGVPIYAIIATALGVFGCDPLAQDVRRRVRPSYVYMYMVMTSLYVYAILAESRWHTAAMIALTSLLAVALWQRARDHLPYLLDPSAAPPSRVSVSDGLMAALTFFVLQGMIVAFWAAARPEGAKRPPGTLLLIAFAVAGGLTFSVFRYVYWRAKTQGVPHYFGARAMRAMGWGVGCGATAAIIGAFYLRLIAHTALFKSPSGGLEIESTRDLRWIVPLALLAAPLCEEFIFRGVLFGGMRRSWGVWPSLLASAALFALVHPPVSAVPVFGLGILAALAYERTQLLISPAIAHAVYNAAVLAMQLPR
jgi:membrane protease YdiL (CAAX protease family)